MCVLNLRILSLLTLALGAGAFNAASLAENPVEPAAESPHASQPPPGEALRPLVEEVLDQPARNVEVKDRPLADALADLEKQTGLKFILSPQAMDLMPYAEKTRISVSVQGVTLRRGLERVFDGLGLMMRIEGDKIMVEEAPVLMRMGRRLTITEIELLGKLASPTRPENVATTYRIDPRQNPKELLANATHQVAAPNALRALELATDQLGWTWVVEDDTVVVYTRRDDVLARLDRPLDLTYQHVTLDELLMDLAARAGVDISIEPGALKRVNASERTVDLVQRQTSVKQVLERICGNTGLRWEASDQGLRILGPLDGGSPSASDRARIAVIVEVEIDGKKVQFPYREDEVSERLRNLRQEVREDLERWAVDQMRSKSGH